MSKVAAAGHQSAAMLLACSIPRTASCAAAAAPSICRPWQAKFHVNCTPFCCRHCATTCPHDITQGHSSRPLFDRCCRGCWAARHLGGSVRLVAGQASRSLGAAV